MSLPNAQEREQAARVAAATHALRAAGIPAEFHSKTASLTEHEQMPGVSALKEILRTRTPWNRASCLVVDQGARAGAKITYLIARALVVSGVAARCFTLPQLVQALEEDERGLVKELESECDVLVLLGFCDLGVSPSNPYPARLVQRIEWFLTGQIMEGRGLVLHTRSPGMTEWWSPRLVAAVREIKIAQVTA